MAIFRLTEDNFRFFSLETNPKRTYISGSGGQITGSIGVFPRASRALTNFSSDVPPAAPGDPYSDQLALVPGAPATLDGVDNYLAQATDQVSTGNTDVENYLNNYLSDINIAAGTTWKLLARQDVTRIEPVLEMTSPGEPDPGKTFFFKKTQFTGSSNCKRLARDVFIPQYRTAFPKAMNYAYTNYHCLNFFTASSVPSESVIMYPNSASQNGSRDLVSGSYVTEGPFSFDFYINPKYTTDSPKDAFKAGTIFHLSSCYALSLVTGSTIDQNGLANSYRLMLQLSHSADISPSEISLDVENNQRSKSDTYASVGSGLGDLIFLSKDNRSLKRNHWHHVCVRWGTKTVNDGTGSFTVDGVEQGQFYVPSSTIAPRSYPDGSGIPGNPAALCVGNFYQGPNNGRSSQSFFFTSGTFIRDGTKILEPGESKVVTPVSYAFNHPLNAEMHDLKIHKVYRNHDEISLSMTEGLSDLSNLLFYVPPLFVKESPKRANIRLSLDYDRKYYFDNSEYRTTLGTGYPSPKPSLLPSTKDPFGTDLSFRIGGRDVNVENFVRDFKTGNYPRLFKLTGSNTAVSEWTAAGGTNPNLTTFGQTNNANDVLFFQDTHKKRNLTVLPCDNGKFKPSFELLLTGAYEQKPLSGSGLGKFVNDLGHLDLSLIHLDSDLSLTEHFQTNGTAGVFPIQMGIAPVSGSVPTLDSTTVGLLAKQSPTYDASYKVWPSSPAGIPNVAWEFSEFKGNIASWWSNAFHSSSVGLQSVLQETADTTSNEVVIFSLGNLFYGDRILEGSFQIKDTNLTGSDGKVSMVLKDDSFGGLYRADCLTDHATWNSVGNVFYKEGMILIKSPNIPLFGKDQYQISLQGSNKIHTMVLDILAPANMVNSSSNPTCLPLSASMNANDRVSQFTQISGIYFHDENLNVVMKTSLAQPIVKRVGDKILFRVKMDY